MKNREQGDQLTPEEAAALQSKLREIRQQEAKIPEYYERYKDGTLQSREIADELGLHRGRVNKKLRDMIKAREGE